MSAVLLVLSPRPTGFVATCQLPLVIAMGATAMIAAENALLAVRASLSKTNLPATLILRTEMPHCTTVVMQPIGEPIRLDRGRVEPRPAPSAAT